MRCLILFGILTALTSCSAEKILFVGAVGTKSHRIIYTPILEALAARGHSVTVVTPFPSGKNLTNIREVIVEDGSEKHTFFDFFEMQKESFVTITLRSLKVFQEIAALGYEIAMASPEFRRIVQQRDVDFVIIDCVGNDFMLPIVDHLKVPFGFFSAIAAMGFTSAAMGMPQEYATIPSLFLDLDDRMNVFQRLVNFMSSEVMVHLRRNVFLPALDQLASKDFPGGRPGSQVELDASLCLMNYHPVTAYPRPFPPNVIPIGPTHTRPARPLPQDLQKLADESTSGFIVFTLGSFIAGSSLPEDILAIFLQAFARIPQRIFWKWEKSADIQFPPNVVVVDWLPQQDLLGHPNCRLFISHGGLLGIQEAIYHGVPMLGLPFGNDHQHNIAKSINEGYALRLAWDKLKEPDLYSAITTLITDPSYRANATRLSRMLRDEVIHGTDLAVYWIEHVLRHGGAQHLQVASRKLPFYQSSLLDVIVLFIVIIEVSLLALYLLVRFSLRKLTNILKGKVKTS